MTEAEVLKVIKEAEKDGRTELDLSRKKLKSLPEEIGSLTNLTHLNMSSNQLSTLPQSIGNLTNLTCLNLYWNQLTSIPESIGNLTNLTTLSLDRNRLTSIPQEIGNLTNVSFLSLYWNQLTSIPESIGNLTYLKSLSLGRNRLTSIPQEIGNLTNLTHLDLYWNQLTSIPGSIGGLTKLRNLYLDRNQLTSIPQSIGNLANLKDLLLRDNELVSLPQSVGKLNRLVCFRLGGNPMTSLPPEVREKGDKAILEYYRNLAAGKGRRYEAKLVIVGQGGVGKTCLSRGLRGLKFVPQPKTSGVEVRNWTFPHPDTPKDREREITLHIWDFEGQQITHSTHQFFLTGRSLYLLVFNARQGADPGRLPYWLETIRARAPECEVILIASECARCTPKVDYQRLKERFKEQLCADDYFRIDSGTGQGIKELKEEISRRASQLELMGHEWPQAYADVEAAVRKKEKAKKAHVTRTELYKMMSKDGIHESQHEMLSRILGDLGTLTHFPDSMYLHDLIVLNPEWLTGAISNALEYAPLEKSGGYLEHHWLTKLWSKKYRGLVGMFHRCMEEFEICYPIEGDNSQSLVPLRFRPERPEIPWEDDPDAVSRFVHYHFQFIPAGVMARFIVKTHRMGTGVFWENGVFLKKDRSQALCRLDPDDDRISIEVRSVYPQSFMEQLCGYLEAILDPFEGLKYEKKLGCIASEKIGKCAGEFPYDEVIDALTEPMSTIRCYVSKHYVNTHELVFGLSFFADHLERLERAVDRSKADIIREVLAKLQAVKEDIIYGVGEKQNQMVEQIQREFVKQMNLIDEALAKTCPTLASITPVGRSRLNPANWFSRKYRLHLYCQAEEGIHPVDQTYEFPGSREWWQKVGPHAARFLKILKMVAGPAVAALPIHLNEADWNIMKDEVKLMEEIVKVSELPGVKESLSEDIHIRLLDDPQELEGAALRALSALLQRLDRAGRWGGLQRVRTPDEKYLWLCERHIQEYKRPEASYDKPKK